MIPGNRSLSSLQGIPTLVTGATGKVGRPLVSALLGAGARVSILTRDPARASALWPGAEVRVQAGDLAAAPARIPALAGMELVLHLASHAPPATAANPYGAAGHWAVTVEGTRALLAAAIAAGVSRLVYVSSIKAMGEGGGGDRAADETTPATPNSAYGRAKLEAERLMLQAGAIHGRHVAVLRLPMIYGLGGKGNIARMLEAVARRRFPPWPETGNRRTALHVADAVAAILLAARLPQAAGQVYLVNDGGAYSTRWLYEHMCRALGRPVPAWTLPLWSLTMAAGLGSAAEWLTGRAMPLTRTSLRKLTASAWYSAAKIRRELGFVPEQDLATEILHLARRYRTGTDP